MKQCKQVLTAFQAKRPLKNEKYLGISIPMWNQSGDRTHQVRTEKCWNKFDGWKVGLLSHVGMSVTCLHCACKNAQLQRVRQILLFVGNKKLTQTECFSPDGQYNLV
jgi:hypothetical protein